jgi:EAL domain-containing protein (putative c-di-GMP-specific phosphodiesterase class I)
LLRNADLAMYQAKREGRGRHVLYDPEMHARAVSRFRLEARLQTAVDSGAITLAYQPIVDLRTGVVVGIEALARWSDPELGDVPPSEFIPVAEQTGLIATLGRQVIDQACRDLTRWRAATGGAAYISVNVSPLELDNPHFPSEVERIVQSHGLDPSDLVLEVTEGLLLVERSRESLRELRSFGVRVAIDDFGTGFSSLSYLRSLPVDMVKIDQAFLRPDDIGVGSTDFLSAIIGLAETLHLATIIEGIETDAQLSDLQLTACNYGQGYLLARPGPLEGIPTTIATIGGAPRPARTGRARRAGSAMLGVLDGDAGPSRHPGPGR